MQVVLVGFIWYVIPLLLIEAIILPLTFFQQYYDDEKYHTNSASACLIVVIGENACLMTGSSVASSKAMDLLCQAMGAVTYHCIAMAIEMANKLVVFFHCCFVDCGPDGCRGNTEWVVAWWRHPEASGVAPVMLHWEMPQALLQCIHMAIEMACNESTFTRCRCLFLLL